MKFWEAMRALEEGKRVSCCDFEDPCSYIQKIPNGLLLYSVPIWPLTEYFNSEWELYEEPGQLLSFPEVVKGLRQGKKFRRKGWIGNLSVWIALEGDPQLEDNCRIFQCPFSSQVHEFTMFDFEATDWVEVK